VGVLGGGLTGRLGVEPESAAQRPIAPVQDLSCPAFRLVEDDPQLEDAVAIQVQILEAATEEMGTAREVGRGQCSEGSQDTRIDPLGIGQGAAVNRCGGLEPRTPVGGYHRSFRQD